MSKSFKINGELIISSGQKLKNIIILTFLAVTINTSLAFSQITSITQEEPRIDYAYVGYNDGYTGHFNLGYVLSLQRISPTLKNVSAGVGLRFKSFEIRNPVYNQGDFLPQNGDTRFYTGVNGLGLIMQLGYRIKALGLTFEPMFGYELTSATERIQTYTNPSWRDTTNKTESIGATHLGLNIITNKRLVIGFQYFYDDVAYSKYYGYGVRVGYTFPRVQKITF